MESKSRHLYHSGRWSHLYLFTLCSGKREKDRNDLQKEILESLFNVPERAEEAPKRIHTVRTRAYGHVVTEPLKETTTSFRKTVTVKAKVTEDGKHLFTTLLELYKYFIF